MPQLGEPLRDGGQLGVGLVQGGQGRVQAGSVLLASRLVPGAGETSLVERGLGRLEGGAGLVEVGLQLHS